MRYKKESKEKSNGIVYTPTEMADFLSEQMLGYSNFNENIMDINILDPAVGEGELVISLIKKVKENNHNCHIHCIGYETDSETSNKTAEMLEGMFDDVDIEILNRDFLEDVDSISERFDFIIANPPYIRTQILGSERAQEMAEKMKLSGRIDIYYVFLLNTKQLMRENGVAGYITSNKFFTIKSGKSVRNYMIDNYCMHRIVDFGDTKLFTASVLPCIMVFSKGKTEKASDVKFTSIYECTDDSDEEREQIKSVFEKIDDEGIYRTEEGKYFNFQQGTLQGIEEDALWTIASNQTQKWLNRVDANTWMHFKDIGKVRVGIKTTADNVFIGDDWSGDNSNIELLQPLITHRDAGQIVSPNGASWKVLYTHYSKGGKRKVYDINEFPNTKRYLEKYYEQLSGRTYVAKAKRNWYEIWVPQNPESWKNRKIVFRDISEEPQFWLDETGAIINGDCYWIDINDDVFEDTLYLALAVANSHFIEKYYDAKFNTKLYSGKRRYMTQYVEEFPLPAPNTELSQEAINLVKMIVAGCNKEEASCYMSRLNEVVDRIFA